MNKESIKVSVCMITYAHENYIQEAIVGFLIQECNFEIEIIVADDKSPDKTENVIKSFSNHPKYPSIKYIKHKKNKGMMSNFIWALEQCTGEYIALCDGDDYWTDPLKLQKQVDFLETNVDFVLCHHAFRITNEDDRMHIDRNEYNRKKPIGNFIDVIDFSFPKTLTVIFRTKSLIKYDLDAIYKDITTGDILLWHLILLDGKSYFIDEYMGVYRSHKNGITNSYDFNNSTISKIKILEYIAKKNYFNNNSLLSEYIAKKYLALYKFNTSQENINYLFLSLKFKLKSKYIFWPHKIKNQVRIHWYIKNFIIALTQWRLRK
jgi:glycosyltransferase involved in cell wall biosynthesis